MEDPVIIRVKVNVFNPNNPGMFVLQPLTTGMNPKKMVSSAACSVPFHPKRAIALMTWALLGLDASRVCFTLLEEIVDVCCMCGPCIGVVMKQALDTVQLYP